jgi:arsenate reductase
MAEAILRHVAGGRFEALSAGSHPAGFVHPLAIEAMRQMEIPLEEHTSKSWDEFASAEGGPVDVVITVCDNAAGEACPSWPGDPITAHWSLPDPVYHPGSEEERSDFALRVAQRLCTKIEGLIELEWTMDRAELSKRLAFLSEI